MTTVKQVKRSSDYPMLSITEAWQRISSTLAPLPPVRKSLDCAAGLVLAEDIIAENSMPPFTAASMDGYAVISSDASLEKSITGEQDAGVKLDLSVERETAVRIMTGAPLPAGADAVIPFEKTEEKEGVVCLQVIPKPGENVRPVGLDVMAGETVLPKGFVLGPAELGLLAALGQFQVLAHPRPRISIMATGNELVAGDEILKPGQIRDSNSVALSAAAAACGFEVIAAPQPINDDINKIEQALVEALNNSDMVITSGGVSMGKLDLVK
ncbi:MAG: molybdopterin molybdotransferase MoeA, partial [Candidatus Omnitrophota bacterium]